MPGEFNNISLCSIDYTVYFGRYFWAIICQVQRTNPEQWKSRLHLWQKYSNLAKIPKKLISIRFLMSLILSISTVSILLLAISYCLYNSGRLSQHDVDRFRTRTQRTSSFVANFDICQSLEDKSFGPIFCKQLMKLSVIQFRTKVKSVQILQISWKWFQRSQQMLFRIDFVGNMVSNVMDKYGWIIKDKNREIGHDSEFLQALKYHQTKNC